MAERGVIAVSQPIFIDELGDNFEHHLEDERLYRVYPYRSILNAKVDLAFSTDAPVVRSLNPLQGIAAAVTRRSASGNIIGGDEAVTIAEALRAYTLGGTVASGEELKKGGLQSGYLADLVILSGDPLTTPAEELTSLKVSSTLIGGKLAYVDYATL
jgi:predicted amidohydrolase YtcJ